MAAKKISKERLRYLMSLPTRQQPDWLREELARKRARKERKGSTSGKKPGATSSTKTGGRKPKAATKMVSAHKALKSGKKRRTVRANPA